MKYEIKSEESYNPANNITVLIREPIIALIFLVLFLLVGIFFAILPWGLASNSASLSLQVKLVTSGLGLLCVALVAAVIKSGLNETVIDRNNQMVLFRKRFSGTVTRRISCSNIKDVEIHQSKDSDGDAIYQVKFRLNDGDLVPLHRYVTSSKTTALYDRDRIKFLLYNPYQKFPGKDNTPFISFGKDNGAIGSGSSSSSGSIYSSSDTSPESSDSSTNSSYSSSDTSSSNNSISSSNNSPADSPYNSLGSAYSKKLIDSSSNWIGPVIALLIMVIISPFAGGWLASQEKPSLQEYIQSGSPAPELSQQLKVRAADKIDANEQILFVAKPEPGHEGQVKAWFLPFAIVWSLFSFVWTGTALASAIATKSPGSWFMALFGVPFVVIGIGMLTTPYISYKRELHTIYALTDKRALVFSNDGVRELVAYDDKHFGPIEPKSYSENRTDVMFRSNLDSESPGVTGGFWGIERGDQAIAILQNKWQEKLNNPTKTKGHHRHQHK